MEVQLLKVVHLVQPQEVIHQVQPQEVVHLVQLQEVIHLVQPQEVVLQDILTEVHRVLQKVVRLDILLEVEVVRLDILREAEAVRQDTLLEVEVARLLRRHHHQEVDLQAADTDRKRYLVCFSLG